MSTPAVERFRVRLAVYLILERDGKILMMRRANTGYRDGFYGLVQGHADGGETVQEAMAREAKEEVGIVIDPAALKVVHIQHSPAENEPGHEYVCVYMTCNTLSGEPVNGEPDKCDDIAWFAEASLPTNTIPNVVVALSDIASGRVYGNWGWK
ncbi:NUDIX domain-containing protein [Candidatus Kaiserbacteria bacterium]|nr:NUDIX domain-containing protein [Candidatus Kaiserbacteria bacterium]